MANSEPKILLEDLDVDKLFEELMADNTRKTEPCSEEDWAKFVEGMAEYYGLSDAEKRSWLE